MFARGSAGPSPRQPLASTSSSFSTRSARCRPTLKSLLHVGAGTFKARRGGSDPAAHVMLLEGGIAVSAESAHGRSTTGARGGGRVLCRWADRDDDRADEKLEERGG